ncbi:MAG TPA: hypothetical protein PKN32_07895 [Bacteroidales bacterium]|nr:hypothetical protein [Bacteroidales bacterium]
MKQVLFFVIALLPVFVLAQSKKEVRDNKIKSTTIEKTEQKDGQSITYKEFYEEYDKNGNTILKIEYSKAGDIKKKSTYKFDNFGNVVEKTEYDRKSGATVKTTTKYDAMGEKSEETETDSEGNIIQKQTYKVDGKGLRQEAKEHNGKGELRWIKKYTYETY